MKNTLISLIKKFLKYFNLEIKKTFNPVESSIFDNKSVEIAKKYSMTSNYRLWSIVQIIKYLNEKNIDGDFVECGVWKGGNLILMKMYVDKFNLNKTIFGFDTFEGMTKPGDYDISFSNKNSIKIFKKFQTGENSSDWCNASKEEVLSNIKKELFNNEGIYLVEGRVEETLLNEKNLPKKISLLRLDTDFYQSTKIELEILFPRLVKGGVLIIDDYGYWKGSKKAVDEYFESKNLPLHYIDQAARFYIK